jgi:ABC-type multidrug transport system ATPase subunit
VPVRAAHRPATSAEHIGDRDVVVEVSSVSRRFDTKLALDNVSLRVCRGEIRALLGPNGAGKTTLLRTLSGLLNPDEGFVRVLGFDTRRTPLALRQRVGLVPSGDRSFYLRLSGLENLAFFGRLHGLSRREAVARSLEVIGHVGLEGAERVRVGVYSHGMQKRLSVARALLMNPDVLLIDEATHDLDPDGARQVRELVAGLSKDRGSAVLWATQRLDEIRGFAQSVTLIGHGRVRFSGSVPELMSHALPQRYHLRVRNGAAWGKDLEPILQSVLGETGTISLLDGGTDDFLLSLGADTPLGDALRSLLTGGIQIYACREEQSEIEDAFIRLTRPIAEGAV